jgi:hypothetical protein
VTASGGLVLAVVTDLDEELARRVAALRQPGGTALAVVLDPHAFSSVRRRGDGAGIPGHGAEHAGTDHASTEYARATEARTVRPGDELACVPVLRGAGWTVAVVGSTDDVPSVWSALSHTGHRTGVSVA